MKCDNCKTAEHLIVLDVISWTTSDNDDRMTVNAPVTCGNCDYETIVQFVEEEEK